MFFLLSLGRSPLVPMQFKLRCLMLYTKSGSIALLYFALCCLLSASVLLSVLLPCPAPFFVLSVGAVVVRLSLGHLGSIPQIEVLCEFLGWLRCGSVDRPWSVGLAPSLLIYTCVVKYVWKKQIMFYIGVYNFYNLYIGFILVFITFYKLFYRLLCIVIMFYRLFISFYMFL